MTWRELIDQIPEQHLDNCITLEREPLQDEQYQHNYLQLEAGKDGTAPYFVIESSKREFKIYMTQGQGCGEPVRVVKSLRDALQFVKQHLEEGSFAIQYPNGSWHNWKG